MQVYIAREEGCGGPGRAVWRAAAGPGRQVDRLRVRVGSTTFHTGRVQWQVGITDYLKLGRVDLLGWVGFG